MCCTAPRGLELPPDVAGMLLRYQDMVRADPDGLWGDRTDVWTRIVLRRCPFLGEHRHRELWALLWSEPGWVDSPAFPDWVRRAVADDGRPAELSVVHVGADGAVTVHPATPVRLLPGGDAVGRSLLVDSAGPAALPVRVGEVEVDVPAGGAALVRLELTADAGDVAVSVAGVTHSLRLVTPADPARLRLRSRRTVRWSVVDDRGTGRFPAGLPRKFDYHDRPFFHGDDVTVDVPADVPLLVRATRGLEYRPALTTVSAAPGDTVEVELEPEQWIDPAADGWYGADLHVHMNYGCDLVIGPADAALMQCGEGLHFMNLVAANEASSLIYDREALEAWPGEDLPWSTADMVARMGVEYRNDLLGHFHATGPAAAPRHFHSGHAGSDADEDWPPNSVALEHFRGLDAVTAYCHPVQSPLDDDAPPDVVFELSRSVECRELVADAALGLVDGMDVVSNLDDWAAGVVYRHLLGAGIPLAATVGSDSMLSVSRSATFGNPPGWARMYARLDGPLSTEGLKEAIRARRTVATNGPWLELTVDGHGPGRRLDVAPGTTLRVRAHVRGPGAERLRVYTADGVLAEAAATDGEAELAATLAVTEPTFVVAVADGGGHAEVLADRAMAHTSPVHVDVAGERVARPDHARWCLEWLARLEKLVADHGVFHEPAHREDLAAVIEQARGYYRSVARSR
ncbi:hypothetical protein E1262_14365 [Jiangella aurantiaca]|uniref:Uncharacterized protein n=1 Tax=Jiangella aurantiaca TaxID=2530373 RepID=A0A4R5AB81_9ACTN|nr:CehA/McbA family metallohydrolase [Jiangella aurantiaca]TDD68925.1 hypothetical protein E1262_14365 [Jiangella aurantiaca]